MMRRRIPDASGRSSDRLSLQPSPDAPTVQAGCAALAVQRAASALAAGDLLAARRASFDDEFGTTIQEASFERPQDRRARVAALLAERPLIPAPSEVNGLGLNQSLLLARRKAYWAAVRASCGS